MSSNDWLALWLTAKLATVSTLALMAIGIPLAWWLARSQFRGKAIIEALVALPIVLPPTVIGFYLLIAFAPDTAMAKAWQAAFGRPLAFSFDGLVLGSIIYSLPFVVQPLQSRFEGISRATLLSAASLGAGPMDRFFNIVLPLSKRALLAAAALGFCHTVGEFGIVLMIGGSIPGQTQVLSIALFDHVESMNFRSAHILAMLLLLFSFISLLILYAKGAKTARVVQRGEPFDE
ncbi:MAG: molybdate ABC transporter permease subunit [Gammaproteobacteria bacterium]|nr:molybdate ABC transporter permease subunit [Gammaproteobacteria bacterium]MBT8151506.1 molybdate ABC transporter permease subunit [Gammaproteobacteria bacterium]NND39717.1 molybdate ABC transporter permease subunit [Pseudomonadales bacterium]NNM12606.1 molybdate ABC transporter permease subunit [Pseudomonadales bacterium]RZV59520.1 MAG: molybdate ABC transporter permease subunit [Pseudomonadales bacterium]